MDQKEILRKVRRFLDWSIQSSRNFRRVVLVLLGLGLLGGVLAFWLPVSVTSKAIANAQAAVIAAEKMQQDTVEEYETVIVWFAPGYAVDAPGFIENGTTKIDQAKSLLAQAEKASNPDKRLELVSQANNLVLASVDDFMRAGGSVGGAILQRTLARVELEVLQDSFTLDTEVGPLEDRIASAKEVQLQQYTSELSADLELLRGNIEAVQSRMAQAEQLLPDDGNIERIGDPNRAIQILTDAEILVNESSTIASQMSHKLDHLDEAYRNAFETAEQSAEKCEEAERYIATVQETGYWLLGPAGTYEQGAIYAQIATDTASAQIEGTYDYPAIYKQAVDALFMCSLAISDAQTEVRISDEVRLLIEDFDGEYASASVEVQAMQASVETLNAYHAHNVWVSIEPNIERANVSLDNALVQILYAGDLASMDRQEFYSALAEAESAYRFLDDAKSQSLLVITFTENRERIRAEWPSVRDSATNTINAQTAYILAHGSYSSSARGDYYDAVDLLEAAESEAANRRYESATNLAKEAKELARGTGQRALQAHNAEIAAQAAAAEARRRREEQQQSSSSSWGYDPWESSSSSGGSSGGSLDPYDYDPGGFSSSGGTDPDFGSDFGSDSYWSSGSDSDSGIGSDSDW